MGLLSKGQPLDWPSTKQHADYIRQHGITQFIKHYHRLSKRQGDTLKWGDEIEYLIVQFDHAAKKVQLSLRGAEVLEILMRDEDTVHPENNAYLWRPEYAAYMLEGTPGVPYGGLLACLNVVEDNMARRRAHANKLLKQPDECLLTIPCFPLLGSDGFCTPWQSPQPRNPASAARSLFFPDEAIFGAHPRFATLTRNIRERRGSKVAINVPIFIDEKTPRPFVEDFSHLGDDGEAVRNSKPDHIYMDAMGFGMGCCCLQVTFQSVNVSEARWIYDQLTPLTPIVLALSAASPIWRGYLSAVDSRWDIIAASVDDRTDTERQTIAKSRYDTTDSYLYPCSMPYNDIELQYDHGLAKQMVDGGIDAQMARHVAHLFIRDPVMLYGDRLYLDDNTSTEHFENIQSSNWQNMRFKPPPADDSGIGWRVEFRPIEVQLTDFENAAYVVFVVLLTRVLISFRLSFLIPISKVNENMKRAQKMDAVTSQKYYFRTGLATCNTPVEAQRIIARSISQTDDDLPKDLPSESPRTLHEAAELLANAEVADYAEMTVAEIVNGSEEHGFPGLIPLMFQYLDSADVDIDTRCTLQQYLKFIQDRATGKLSTLARWQRDFVQMHPKYEKDSRVTDEIAYDLVKHMNDVANGRAKDVKLHGEFCKSKTKSEIPEAMAKAETMYARASDPALFKQGNEKPNFNVKKCANQSGAGRDL